MMPPYNSKDWLKYLVKALLSLIVSLLSRALWEWLNGRF